MTSESLALKYRPTSFHEMVGQKLNAVVLQQMVDTQSVPTALLFSGSSGTGKTSAARILASAVGSIDTIEIDAASNGGVAEVRKLIETMRYASGAEYRAVILDEAHSITPEGFEALLKTLEDVPRGTIFILVTTEAYKIPRTVKSRLTEFTFRAVSAYEIHERLAHVVEAESIELQPDLLAYIAQSSEGNVRTALTTLDQAARANIRSVEEYREMRGHRDVAPTLMAAMLSGDAGHIFEVLDTQLHTTGNPAYISTSLIDCIRDLFILQGGGELALTGIALDSRKELARRIERERLLTAANYLWELRTKMRTTDDPRANLELALILMSEVFSRGQSHPVAVQTAPEPTPPAEPPKKMNFADLQKSR